MLRRWEVGLGLLLAGCGPEPCDQDGATRCVDEVAQTCVDGGWEETQDCAAEGLVCHEHEEDVFHCGEDHTHGTGTTHVHAHDE